MSATKAHIAATGRYEKKAYDKILLRIRKDGDITRDSIAEAAAGAGMSVNAFILDAVQKRLEEFEDDLFCEQLAKEAKNDDSGYISFEDALKEAGLTYADIQD